MNRIALMSMGALLAALACGCVTTGAKCMTQDFPPDAQALDTPHPGKVTFVYLWNNAREVESAAKVPDRIKFFCVDKQANEVEPSKAVYCIPVVEIETFSVDEHGKPIVPKDADYIHIRAYGPNHTFLKSTVTPPSRQPPRELLNQLQPLDQEDGVTPRSSQSFSVRSKAAGFAGESVFSSREGRLGGGRGSKLG
jgi:hypothetical protein